jgi:hypothetical protein
LWIGLLVLYSFAFLSWVLLLGNCFRARSTGRLRGGGIAAGSIRRNCHRTAIFAVNKRISNLFFQRAHLVCKCLYLSYLYATSRSAKRHQH